MPAKKIFFRGSNLYRIIGIALVVFGFAWAEFKPQPKTKCTEAEQAIEYKGWGFDVSLNWLSFVGACLALGPTIAEAIRAKKKE